MHGIVKPLVDETAERPDWLELVRRWTWKHRYFLLLVILPTLLVAAYYYVVASDQYESEADFIVRSTQPASPSTNGLNALLASAGTTAVSNDSMSVIDYLRSTEAALAINKSTGMTRHFSGSDIDMVSRLKTSTPTPEDLRKYFNRQVQVKLDKDTGISKLTVHAFTPENAYRIAEDMLSLGEQRVNDLNERSSTDALSGANRQLAEAEADLHKVQVQMTSFRRTSDDIDPEASGRAQVTMVSQLNAGLAASRAQLQAMRGIISPSSPQYIATLARVRALSAEVAGQEGRLAGQGSANTLGNYESLKVRQEFAMKRYDLAAAAYQAAREDARKKKLYLVRVVNPNLPVKALFPERSRIVLTVFAALLIAYGVGWLLLAGIKEHTNG